MSFRQGSSLAHGANGNDDDENDSHRSGYECNQLADLGPAEISLLSPEQSIVAWRVDVVHPELHVVGVQRLRSLRDIMPFSFCNAYNCISVLLLHTCYRPISHLQTTFTCTNIYAIQIKFD